MSNKLGSLLHCCSGLQLLFEVSIELPRSSVSNRGRFPCLQAKGMCHILVSRQWSRACCTELLESLASTWLGISQEHVRTTVLKKGKLTRQPVPEATVSEESQYVALWVLDMLATQLEKCAILPCCCCMAVH
jgi:hypothetical protein